MKNFLTALLLLLLALPKSAAGQATSLMLDDFESASLRANGSNCPGVDGNLFSIYGGEEIGRAHV